jgi:hypothetical protein
MTPASADWNLGTTWTIEFWINANNSSLAGINIGGGQWGLFNQGGWFGGMPANSIIIGLAGGNLTVGQGTTDDAIEFAEPTAQQWTHVAVVNNGGGSAQKVYYNGVEQAKVAGNYLSNGWTNTTDELYIGRLKPPSYGGLFDGKMAMVRISNTAEYLAAFTATTTYGVEADTVLFLDKFNPLLDAKAHTVTNNGVTTSTDVPVIITIATNDQGGLGGWSSTSLAIAYDPDIISTYPVGSTITFQDGSTATITMWDPYGPSYIDLFWDTPKTGTLFPITLIAVTNS